MGGLGVLPHEAEKLKQRIHHHKSREKRIRSPVFGLERLEDYQAKKKNKVDIDELTLKGL
jgi:hypothetical protein